MWKKTAPLLVILSVALNLAFVGVWVAHAVAATRQPAAIACGPASQQANHVWCPLHQRLGVSPEQWKQIEPKLTEFRSTAQATCQEVGRKRDELIGLMAAPQVDTKAIAAKQEEILAGQRKMQALVIGQLLAEKQTLTAAQQKELFDLLRQRSGCPGKGPMMMGLPGGEGVTCPHQDAAVTPIETLGAN